MNNFPSRRQTRKPLLPTLLLGLMTVPSYCALAQSSHSIPSAADTNTSVTLSGEPITLEKAVQITLENSPLIKQQIWTVELAKASYTMAKGQFDMTTSLTASANNNRPAPMQQSGQLMALLGDDDSQNLQLALSKMFRTGISTTLSAGIIRKDERYHNPLISPVGNSTENSSALNLNLTLPLLKGRGRVSAAGTETAARLSSDASQLAFYHQISQLLLSSVNAYWEYAAAVVKLKIQQDSEQRVREWGQTANEGIIARYGDNLALAAKKYEAETARLKGYWADKQRNTIAATEQVNSAKSALAIQMGIPSEQVANLGEPSDPFDADWKSILEALKREPMLDKWTAEALKNRLDLQAAQLRQEAEATKLAKARRDMLPTLNLGLNLGRNALELGDGYQPYVDSLTSDARGTSAGVSLKFSYPLGNHLAKGSRDLANATYQTSLITTNDLSRQISVQVGVNGGMVMRRLREVVAAERSVESYIPALDSQYKQASSNLLDNPLVLFDLLDLEDKLTESLNNQIDSLLELAKSIAELRHNTGTLITINDSEKTITLNEMASLPGM
jgi:outer membrane protein